MKKLLNISLLLLVIMIIGCSSKTDLRGLDKSQSLARESKQGLEKYKNEISKVIVRLKKELDANEEVFVTITFAKPLNNREISSLISDYNLKQKMVTARGIEKSSNLRTTIGAPTYQGINQLTTRDKFIGFIELTAYVKITNLQRLTEDKLVYMVDPLADDYFISNPEEDYRQGVFWYLEDYKMVKN
jgi:hypothetical protein